MILSTSQNWYIILVVQIEDLEVKIIINSEANKDYVFMVVVARLPKHCIDKVALYPLIIANRKPIKYNNE